MNDSVCGLNENNSILMLEMTFHKLNNIEHTYPFYLNLGALHSQMYIAVFFIDCFSIRKNMGMYDLSASSCDFGGMIDIGESQSENRCYSFCQWLKDEGGL